MKTLALIAAAGLASTATAQDMTVLVAPNGNVDGWDITATFNSTPATPIVQVWADVSFNLAGADAITIDSFNAAYNTTLGPAVITGNGSTSVDFVGNANAFFGTPDNSNPLLVASFTSASAPTALTLFGQNSAIFDLPPFGDVQEYLSATGDAGTLSFEVVIVPAPASAALLGLGGLAAIRRRR